MRIYDIDNSERLKLVEGVQYGNKQSQWVESNLDLFNIGLEAELVIPDITDESNEISIEDAFETGATISSDTFYRITEDEEFGRYLASMTYDLMEEHEVYDAMDGVEFDFLFDLLNETEALEIPIKRLRASNEETMVEDFKLLVSILYRNRTPDQLREIIKPLYDLNESYTDNSILDAVLNGNNAYADIHEFIVELDSINEVVDENDLTDPNNIDQEIVDDNEKYISDFASSLVMYMNNAGYYLEFYDNDILSNLRTYFDATYVKSNTPAELYDDINDFYSIEPVEFIDKLSTVSLTEERAFYEHESDADMAGITQEQAVSQVEDIIRDMDYDHMFHVEEEGSDMVEIISDEGLSESVDEIYDAMFEIIEELTKQGYSSRDSGDDEQGSGFHISISKKDYSGITDPAKFLLLSNILELLPNDEQYVRNYVDNITDDLMDGASFKTLLVTLIANKIMKGEPLSKDYSKIIESWVNYYISKNSKYQTVNFSSMNTQKGRIEIRMFGGEGYDRQKKLMWDETIRSMYALHLADSETEGRREYLKIIHNLVNTVFQRNTRMDTSTYFVKAKKWYDFLDSVSDGAVRENINLITCTLSTKITQLSRDGYLLISTEPYYVEQMSRLLDSKIFEGVKIIHTGLPTYFMRNEHRVLPYNTDNRAFPYLVPDDKMLAKIKSKLPEEIKLWKDMVVSDGKIDKDKLDDYLDKVR